MRILLALACLCLCAFSHAAPLIITDPIPVSGHGDWVWASGDSSGGITFLFSGTSGEDSVVLHLGYPYNNFPSLSPNDAYYVEGTSSDAGGFAAVQGEINGIYGPTASLIFYGDGLGLFSLYGRDGELLASAALAGYMYATSIEEHYYGPPSLFTRYYLGVVAITPTHPFPPDPEPVPEPATAAMLAGALVGLVGLKRRLLVK